MLSTSPCVLCLRPPCPCPGAPVTSQLFPPQALPCRHGLGFLVVWFLKTYSLLWLWWLHEVECLGMTLSLALGWARPRTDGAVAEGVLGAFRAVFSIPCAVPSNPSGVGVSNQALCTCQGMWILNLRGCREVCSWSSSCSCQGAAYLTPLSERCALGQK